MDALQAIYTRKTVRKFLDKPVEWDKVIEIIDSARHAATAGNLQPWKFIVVTNHEKKRALADAALQQWWMEASSLYVVVVADLERHKQLYGQRGVEVYALQDCAAATQNMLITATALGVGSAWVGAFDEEMVSRELGLPDTARATAIVCLGYSAEEPKSQVKQPIITTVFLEKYGNRVRDPLRMYFGMYSHIWESYIGNGIKAVQAASENVRSKIRDFGKKFLTQSDEKEESSEKKK